MLFSSGAILLTVLLNGAGHVGAVDVHDGQSDAAVKQQVDEGLVDPEQVGHLVRPGHVPPQPSGAAYAPQQNSSEQQAEAPPAELFRLSALPTTDGPSYATLSDKSTFHYLQWEQFWTGAMGTTTQAEKGTIFRMNGSQILGQCNDTISGFGLYPLATYTDNGPHHINGQEYQMPPGLGLQGSRGAWGETAQNTGWRFDANNCLVTLMNQEPPWLICYIGDADGYNAKYDGGNIFLSTDKTSGPAQLKGQVDWHCQNIHIFKVPLY